MKKDKDFRSDHKKGFTLVELIVVLVILAILAAILIPTLTGYIQKARETVCQTQRKSLERYFKAMYVAEDEIRGAKDIIEIKAALGGQDILDYMVSERYCEEKETVCPVYHVKYQVDFRLNASGQVEVEFACPCVKESVLGYVSLAEKLFGDKLATGEYKPWTDRKNIISDVYNARGGLMEVTSSFTSGTVFEDKKLYWRPYQLTDGRVILYAGEDSGNSHNNWYANLVYVDGAIYVSTAVGNGGKAQPSAIAAISGCKNYEEVKDWLTLHNFTAK
jgi:prepilin-type N-terminal cleavage/methylation domain-containing protein